MHPALLKIQTFAMTVLLVLSISSVSSYAEELSESIRIPLSFDSSGFVDIDRPVVPPVFPKAISIPSNTVDEMPVSSNVLYVDTYMSSDKLMVPLNALDSLTESDVFSERLNGASARSGNKIELIAIGGEYFVWLRAYAEYFGYTVDWQRTQGIIRLTKEATVVTVVPNVLPVTQIFANNNQPISIRRLSSNESSISSKGRIALTFDDGPHPNYTPAILSVLSAYGVRATFFEIGSEAKRLPDLVKKVVGLGNEIGNHTLNHKDLTVIPLREATMEIQMGKSVLEAVSGVSVRLIRLPYGTYKDEILDRANEYGETVTFWSVDPRDWEEPGVELIVSRVLNNLRDGDVVLLHERLETVAALPMILDGIEKKGYEAVTVSELMGDEG